MSMRKEVVISGLGGQGIIKAGEVLARAFFNEGYEVVQTQSFGAEARVGVCRSELIVSDKEIYDLAVTNPDILLIMSLEAYEKHVGRVKSNGLAIIDSEVIRGLRSREIEVREDIKVHEIPAIRSAVENISDPISANMVLLGFFSRKTGLIKLSTLRRVISRAMRDEMKERNLRALEVGFRLA